jgi:hypothetical protein
VSADPVTIAYLHQAEVAYCWHHSMWQLFIHDLGRHGRVRRGGLLAMRCNAGAIAEARNRGVHHFLTGSQVPWLLWLDTDMGFPPDLAERLVSAADPTDRPIVGALCFAQREVDPDPYGGYRTAATPTIFRWAKHGDLEGFDIATDYPPDKVVRCDATGSAAILIHRGVLEQMYAKYGPAWYDRVPAQEGAVGEDLSFCLRARELDIPVHVDTGTKTTHLKHVWVAEADFHAQAGVLEGVGA